MKSPTAESGFFLPDLFTVLQPLYSASDAISLKHALKHRLSPTSIAAIAENSAHPYTAPPFVPVGL